MSFGMDSSCSNITVHQHKTRFKKIWMSGFAVEVENEIRLLIQDQSLTSQTPINTPKPCEKSPEELKLFYKWWADITTNLVD